MSYYYTYLTTLENGQLYIGSRQSKVSPELDVKYFGSPSKKCKNWRPKSKTILGVFNSNIEVLSHEIELHELYDVGSNPLFYNKAKQTHTGFNRRGVKLSEEHREMLRGNQYSLGHKHTEETLQKMSDRAKSPERIKYAQNLGKARAKPIVLIKEGVEVYFNSATEAVIALNLSGGHLSGVLNGKCNSCKGYTARFV